MLRYALIYITAFMFVSGRYDAQTTGFRPPFSDNFLQKVADFDNIVERDYDEDSNSNVIKTRESVNEEDGGDLFNTDLHENCVQCRGNVDVIPQTSPDDKIKRELGQMGTVFVRRFLGSGTTEKRRKRGFNIAVSSLTDEDTDENKAKNGDEDKSIDSDKDFRDEQSKAKNVTNATQVFFDELENPPPPDHERIGCCLEDKGIADEEEELVGFNAKKNMGGNDLLEMHFYKYLPDTDKIKISPNDKKSLLINLYPEPEKSKSIQTPEKYDYIGLLSKGNSLIKVPAVKFTVVPEVNEDKRRSCDHFEPFYISKYRKQPRHLRFEPTDNLFDVVDYGETNRPWSHGPILFVNAIPDSKRNRLNKRAANFDVSNNQYLREADLLIQNVNASLRMGLSDKKTKSVNAGVLMNRNFQSGAPL